MVSNMEWELKILEMEISIRENTLMASQKVLDNTFGQMEATTKVILSRVSEVDMDFGR